MSKLSHFDAVARLRAAGIDIVSSGNCSDKSNPRCTSLEGIRSNTIDGIITLKRASGASITITGGTEEGHPGIGLLTHANGYKLDIRKNSAINAYITGNFTRIANRGDFPQYRSAAGNLYVNEGNQWVITYI